MPLSHNLLAVFAHPDDETVVGPLLARYAHEGHSVHLLTLTAGERGYREHVKIPVGEELAAVRAKEFDCAAAALGISGHTLLRFPDQGFSSTGKDPIWQDAATRIRETIERLRPDVVITWGPEGGTGHPDHRATSSLVVQVFQQQSLLQHKPCKLYYTVLCEDARPPQEDWAPQTRVSRRFVTTEIDCRSYVNAAQHAIECYRSQWPPDLMARVRGICESERGLVLLRLAYSTVESKLPETDIFAGL